VQYVGLALGVASYAVIITPLLFIAMAYTRDAYIIHKAALFTLLIFAGLTATVFITRKDFSFLRGILVIATFAAFGIIVASIIFGFHLGTIFTVAMIVLMAGFILYQTSLLMAYFHPAQHVAAALMLFSTIATLFYYVLTLLMSLGRD
jgi:FtsH-binding integral membrane protein